MFSASVVLKHIHKVTEKLIFSPPLHVLLGIVILNGPAISQYPKGHVKEVKILTSRSPCEYVLALRKQKT